MKIVSVINIKGGVGKTTLTSNLGAYAASQGKRVLMIDLDPQTQLTFSFMTPEYWRDKYKDSKTLKNYFDPIITGSDEIISLSDLVIHLNPGNILTFSSGTLDLISSHLGLIDIDVKLAGLINVQNSTMYSASFLKTHSYLTHSLEEIENDYDIVLIDCPPTFNTTVKNAILASDYYIVPAKLDYLSTLGIEELKQNIDIFTDEYHNHRDNLRDLRYLPVFPAMLGVVPMMAEIRKGDEPVAAQQEYKDELTKKGYHIFQFVRNNATLFGPSSKEGIPAILTRPKFFTLTAKKIVSELQNLGSEFLQALKI